MFIPLSILSSLPSLASLPPSLPLLVAALTNHPTLTLSEEQTSVRPNIHVERTTIILRELSSSTPEEDLKQKLFSWEGCPPVKGLRRDVEDTWFVVFATEKEAKKVLEKLRELLWEGGMVKARLKSENVINKAFFSGGGGREGGQGGGGRCIYVIRIKRRRRRRRAAKKARQRVRLRQDGCMYLCVCVRSKEKEEEEDRGLVRWRRKRGRGGGRTRTRREAWFSVTCEV